jgi:hypothetical protein
MDPRPLNLRALLFLYSNANIVGCAVALVGPALLFAGVIQTGWLAITAGLYGVGWLLGRRQPELERHIADSLTAQQTLQQLGALLERARPHLDKRLAAHLDGIAASVTDVLPRLQGQDAVAAGGDQLFTLRETVLRYLPETLANYMALPPLFRTTHVLKDGKTAQQILLDQLTLLDDKLREMVVNATASDAQALLANGQFLEQKFRQPDFLAR